MKLKEIWLRLKLMMFLFINDQTAAVNLNEVIAAAVGLLLVAFLSPIAIGTIMNATTTGWPTVVKTMFQQILTVLYIIGMGIYFIPKLNQ
jgi:ABC-type polysaccharide transport system permease subunit